MLLRPVSLCPATLTLAVLISIAIFGRCAIPVMNYGSAKLLVGCIVCPPWPSKYFRIIVMLTVTIVAHGLFEMG